MCVLAERGEGPAGVFKVSGRALERGFGKNAFEVCLQLALPQRVVQQGMLPSTRA